MASDDTLRAPDIWLGGGFWKFAYVTTDLDRAIEQFQNELGIEVFDVHDPVAFDVTMADGRSGTVHAKAAFTVGRPTFLEFIQPVDGLIDFWVEPLRGASGFAVAFHHVGLMVDDLDAMKRAAALKGIYPSVESPVDAFPRFIFYTPPGLGYHVYHCDRVQSEGLMTLANRPLPES